MLTQLFEDDSIKLATYKTLLDEQIKITEKIEGKICYKNTKDDKEINKTITTSRKRKDKSLLKKYTFNKPLLGYLEYYPKHIITEEEIRKELSTYHSCKQDIFKATFALEQLIIEKDKTTILEKTEGERHISFDIYLQWLQAHSLIAPDMLALLKEIRDKFAHNQYPRKMIISSIKIKEDKSVATQITEWYVSQMEKIITKIEKTEP